jgi:hypothetical protein
MKEDIVEDVEKIEEPWHKGPIRVVLALFLILIVVMMVVPYYAVRMDPEPSVVLGLEEVLVSDEIGNSTHKVESLQDFLKYVKGDDEMIKNAATKIVATGCSGNDEVCKAKVLFYFVRDNVEYVSDPVAMEYVQDARDVLFSGGGDCDDHSILLASLMSSVGLKQRLVFVPGHVYNQVYLPNALSRYRDEEGWVNVDATCGSCEFGEIMVGVAEKEKKMIG